MKTTQSHPPAMEDHLSINGQHPHCSLARRDIIATLKRSRRGGNVARVCWIFDLVRAAGPPGCRLVSQQPSKIDDVWIRALSFDCWSTSMVGIIFSSPAIYMKLTWHCVVHPWSCRESSAVLPDHVGTSCRSAATRALSETEECR